MFEERKDVRGPTVLVCGGLRLEESTQHWEKEKQETQRRMGSLADRAKQAAKDLAPFFRWFDDETLRTRAPTEVPDYWCKQTPRQHKRWLENYRKSQHTWRSLVEGPFRQHLLDKKLFEQFHKYNWQQQKDFYEKWKHGPGWVQKPPQKAAKFMPARPKAGPPRSEVEVVRGDVPVQGEAEQGGQQDEQMSRKEIRGLSPISSDEL